MFEGEIIYFDRTIYRGQTKHTKFKHGYGKLFKSNEEVIEDGFYRNNKLIKIYIDDGNEDKKKEILL